MATKPDPVKEWIEKHKDDAKLWKHLTEKHKKPCERLPESGELDALVMNFHPYRIWPCPFGLFVADSKMPRGGKGLYSFLKLPAHTIIAHYNGIVMDEKEFNEKWKHTSHDVKKRKEHYLHSFERKGVKYIVDCTDRTGRLPDIRDAENVAAYINEPKEGKWANCFFTFDEKTNKIAVSTGPKSIPAFTELTAAYGWSDADYKLLGYTPGKHALDPRPKKKKRVQVKKR